MKRRIVAIVSTAALAYVLTIGARAQDSDAAAKPSRTNIQTVFIILMENHNWSQIKGSRYAPYINNTLLPMASHAEQYFNPPGIHPSLPNYLWLEAGTNFGILDDNPPSLDHQSGQIAIGVASATNEIPAKKAVPTKWRVVCGPATGRNWRCRPSCCATTGIAARKVVGSTGVNS